MIVLSHGPLYSGLADSGPLSATHDIWGSQLAAMNPGDPLIPDKSLGCHKASFCGLPEFYRWLKFLS